MQAARAVIAPSPRIKMAARLYASGAVKTKREAAKVAQINPEWFTTMTNHNEETRRIVGAVDQAIDDQSVDMSAVLRTVGREAIKRIHGLMLEENPHIALKAAVDLADRSPETSKIQRHEIAAMTVRAEDAKELASALVAAAEAKRRFAEQVKDGLVRVNVEVEDAKVPAHITAGNGKEASDGQEGSSSKATRSSTDVLDAS